MNAVMQQTLRQVVSHIQQKNYTKALAELKREKSSELSLKKVECYLLLKSKKYPEADSLITKLLTNHGLDHELLNWRGIARAELGVWLGSLMDFRDSMAIFPDPKTEERIRATGRRACQNLSESMQLDGPSFREFVQRARIYSIQGDRRRSERDLASADRLQPDSSEVARVRADLAMASGDYRQAVLEINRFLNENDADLDAQLLKARVKAESGRLRAALSIIRRVSRDYRMDESALLKIGDCRFAIRDFHGAIRVYSQALQLHPNSSGAMFQRGKAYHEIRRFDLAIAEFENAIEITGENAVVLAALGEARLSKASHQEAAEHFEQASRIDPKCWQAELGKARVQNVLGNRTRALQIASSILKNHPDRPEVYNFVGIVQFDEKDFLNATESFTKAIQFSRDRYRRSANYYRRGTANLENERIADAVRDFDQALKLRPFHVGTQVWRGYAYGKLGRWADAINDLQLAMDLNPMASEQYEKLGQFISRHAIKHFDGLIAESKQAAAGGADQVGPDVYYNRAMAHTFLGDFATARSDFQAALKLDENHFDSQFRLGCLLLKIGEAKAASNYFTGVIKKQPTVNSLLMRAESMLQLGVIQPAFLDIRKAVRMDRNNERLYLRRGELYLARGNLEKALDDFTLAIALNHESFQAFRSRSQVFQKKELFADAIADLTLSLHFYPRQPNLLIERGKLHLKLHEFESAAEDFETALSSRPFLEAYVGRARALFKLEKGQNALIWLTKGLHRFRDPEEWAKLVKARADIFLEMGRFERASADARIASKISSDEKLSADCYYLRAMASHFHKDRVHCEKSLEKALDLNPDHKDAELALDWFREMADEPPAQWMTSPRKIRPTRPKAVAERREIPSDEKLKVEPPFDLWLVRVGEEEFGPIPLNTVLEWAKDGRITADCRLFRSDWGKWTKASKVFAELDPANSSFEELIN